MAPIKYPQLHDREWVTQRYVAERKSGAEIAAEVGCSVKLVSNALTRFGISRGYVSRNLSRADRDRWLESGGVDARRPVGPTEHKAAVEELGLSKVSELIVLDITGDPFYCGTDGHVRDAQWFAEQWWAHGATGHLRRLHYRLVSGEEQVTFADGKPYVNTMACFDRLCRIGAQARHLGLADPALFEDRRNPDPIINAFRRLDDPEPRALMDATDGSHWHSSLPWMSGPWSLTVGELEIPEPIVSGYDYEQADQPVLIEVWIEKTTMNDILEPLCRDLGLNLVPASGMQSITNAVKLLRRCQEHDKPGHVIYISDFDPAGDSMPRAVARQLEFYRESKFPDVEVSLEPVALTFEQAANPELNLPRKPATDARRQVRFEERFDDEGVVELDALEAIHPGLLERLVNEAVKPYRDPDLREELASTAAAASDSAAEQWAEETAELREKLDELASDAKEAAEPFRARLTELSNEFEAVIGPIGERAKELEGELQELMDDFDPELPERPEAEPPDVDDEDPLFDSRRHWLDQLERYREGR